MKKLSQKKKKKNNNNNNNTGEKLGRTTKLLSSVEC
jgi:hypothetical protein